MKLLTLILAMTALAATSYAECDKELKEAKKKDSNVLILTFDGLGTAELGMKVLKRTFYKTASERCGDKVANGDFYYSKRGARKAVACAQSFKKHFGNQLEVNIVGHSYGGGKGVFNFLKAAKKAGIKVTNAVTFDARGYSYKYSNPGKSQVRNFVNIYQRVPLAGQLVKGADFQQNVTGEASHVGLPRSFSDLALSKMVGLLSCAR